MSIASLPNLLMLCVHMLVSIATCLSVTPAQVTAGTTSESFGQFLFNVLKYFKGLPADEKEQILPWRSQLTWQRRRQNPSPKVVA